MPPAHAQDLGYSIDYDNGEEGVFLAVLPAQGRIVKMGEREAVESQKVHHVEGREKRDAVFKSYADEFKPLRASGSLQSLDDD
eukprot:14320692-Alexandrium_andersonii.AAC.1